MKRRQFAGLMLSGIGYSLLPRTLFANSSNKDYPYQSLNKAFELISTQIKKATPFLWLPPIFITKPKEQMEWLIDNVKSIPKKQTVVVLIHQPSMSHRVNERGIPKAISEAFEKHRGLIWLIGGHEHTNAQEIFQLKKTKLIEHQITCGTANLWGGDERPGY